jgi:hypothetical protein
MLHSGHNVNRIFFKAVVLLIGLNLFADQISYKFYQRASMPVFKTSVDHHLHHGYGVIWGQKPRYGLSLDKRFEPNPFIPLLTPVIFFDHPGGRVELSCCPPDMKPPVCRPVLATLRGPPILVFRFA